MACCVEENIRVQATVLSKLFTMVGLCPILEELHLPYNIPTNTPMKSSVKR